MEINKNDTAVLVTDPQNDFLSEKAMGKGMLAAA